MHENINEKISQFLDDEMNAEEAMALLQQIRLDDTLRNKLLRYQAMGHAIKTDTFIAPRTDFLDRIHQEIEHDPVYLLPKAKREKFKPQHKILALVASLALVAVILPKDMTSIHGSQMRASSGGMTIAQRNATRSPENVVKQMPHAEPINTQINEYLQAQNKNAPAKDELPASAIAETAAYGRK